ncbi:pilus assembly PilX family protein [Geobacter anodireducens]|uniref:Pilus assembly protein PilX n=1 Tax=Geobacter soli TaxID=1510391 RepID=A0A0C1TTT9_9BACT|nr:PilX N-terminal domain-containing pilus assembly protein [Geobacter soli]ANA40794.1 pilus assembly protein PilX [Geobacter anodireducens]KIE42873.1 pilus assembly protein PilX [Geobacter soli]
MVRPLTNNRGAALALALVLMVVLSLMVAILYRTTLMDMLFSTHYQESQKAFFAAESGVKAGLAWLANQGSAPENQLNPAPWFSNTTTSRPTAATVWSDAEPVTADGVESGRFRYYIQHLKNAPASYAGGESAKLGTSTSAGAMVHYYRITSEGENRNATVTRHIQVVTTAAY